MANKNQNQQGNQLDVNALRAEAEAEIRQEMQEQINQAVEQRLSEKQSGQAQIGTPDSEPNQQNG